MASTKRAPAMVDGVRGDAVAMLAEVRCSPLDPVDAETRQRQGLESPYRLFQTMTYGSYDIQPGDLLVVGDVEYPVKEIALWPGGVKSESVAMLYIEESLP